MKGTRQPLSPYYQALADILTIFWEYHKARLEAGTIAFGYENGTRGIQPYNGPAQILYDRQQSAEILERENSAQIDIIKSFSHAVFRSLSLSWYDFIAQYQPILHEDNITNWQDDPREIRQQLFVRAGNETSPYISQYVHNLLVDCVIEQHGIPSSPLFAPIVPVGLSTGTHVTVDLLAVMNKFFKPTIPLLVSRTSLSALAFTRSVLGKNSYPQPYSGIDPTSRAMLDMERLIEANYGRAMGCPAGHMPTEETQQFLETATGHRTSLPMLVDFSKELHKEYERTIMEWWKGLSQEEQLQAQSQITEECYLLLTGKRWEALREQREARQQTEGNGHTTEVRRRGPRRRK